MSCLSAFPDHNTAERGGPDPFFDQFERGGGPAHLDAPFHFYNDESDVERCLAALSNQLIEAPRSDAC